MGIERYSERIESAISGFTGTHTTPESLYEPIAYGMEAGGKRLRPALLLMTAEAFGLDPELAMSQAVGIEMFHNFTLLHDDVMDNSPTRRGRSSVFAKWGVDVAILSGDTMLTQASQLMAATPDDKLRRVLETFDSMAIDVYEGQAYDKDFEERADVSIDEYIRMISLKTGALLGAAAQIGALVAVGDKDRAEAMRDYGMNLGVAFQIQDDFLDVYGDPATFGKPIGGDINNNKKTFLLITALGLDSTGALAKALAMDAGEEKVKVVTGIYDKLGIKEICHKEIERYTALALDSLRKAGLSAGWQSEFESLAHKLTGRRK